MVFLPRYVSEMAVLQALPVNDFPGKCGVREVLFDYENYKTGIRAFSYVVYPLLHVFRSFCRHVPGGSAEP